MVSGDHAPVGFGVALPWLHTTRFGDGTSTFQSNTRGAVDGTHAYHRAKTYTMSHSVLCTCASVFAAGSASRTFVVPGGNLCRPACGADVNNPPRVSIQSASIPNDQIAVTLVGPGCSGDLEVKITGGRTHDVATVSQARAGNHTINFRRDVIPEGRYERVEATWRVRDDLTPNGELSYTFSALGAYTHSQYNKPNQAH